ncbi:GrpB family protein [Halobacillus yeomjeoni]|uniref:Uncharacterized protein n=1 Tax=Halobacillus yeomjeoni TaxID=311194 RepID=A0A931HUW6_9BACI|nr:hypothetical protein [Halobacillus yeomjeoni]MBH0230207.1 hypothetical protein [Halobacillus yeomjeoni]MCA0982424.1 GrpB family protein [Halobacillus yeomjeoni]
MSNHKVQLMDYQDEWPELFEKEKTAIKNKVGNEISGIEHKRKARIFLCI